MSVTLNDATEPLALFDVWLSDAVASEPDVPNAMQLGTVGADGAPRVRTVLLKAHRPRGFVFFTNHDSRKGQNLAHEPRVALTFHWKSRERQVHVLGRAEHVPNDDADAYFASRPRGSQIAAWASRQSEPIDPPEALPQRVAEVETRFRDRDVPRPPFWGGYCVVPCEIEFWQGQADRLHRRVQFVRRGERWHRAWLYP